MYRTWKKIESFLDDWIGEPARPGVPERLGVMDRISRIEHEVKPNGGSSMRDEIQQIKAALAAHP